MTEESNDGCGCFPWVMLIIILIFLGPMILNWLITGAFGLYVLSN